MEEYGVLAKKSAVRELDAVTGTKNRQRPVARIRALATEPRPAGCEKLSGHHDRHGVRQGAYRVVKSVSDADRLVDVVKIGHRRVVCQ